MGEAKRRKEEIKELKKNKDPISHKNRTYLKRQKAPSSQAFRFKHPNKLTTREMTKIVRRDLGLDKVEVTQESNELPVELDHMVNPERRVNYL